MDIGVAVLREERKAFFQYRPGLDYRRGECKGEKQSRAEHRGESGYLRRRLGSSLRSPGSWGSDYGLSY